MDLRDGHRGAVAVGPGIVAGRPGASGLLGELGEVAARPGLDVPPLATGALGRRPVAHHQGHQHPAVDLVGEQLAVGVARGEGELDLGQREEQALGVGRGDGFARGAARRAVGVDLGGVVLADRWVDAVDGPACPAELAGRDERAFVPRRWRGRAGSGVVARAVHDRHGPRCDDRHQIGRPGSHSDLAVAPPVGRAHGPAGRRRPGRRRGARRSRRAVGRPLIVGLVHVASSSEARRDRSPSCAARLTGPRCSRGARRPRRPTGPPGAQHDGVPLPLRQPRQLLEQHDPFLGPTVRSCPLRDRSGADLAVPPGPAPLGRDLAHQRRPGVGRRVAHGQPRPGQQQPLEGRLHGVLGPVRVGGQAQGEAAQRGRDGGDELGELRLLRVVAHRCLRPGSGPVGPPPSRRGGGVPRLSPPENCPRAPGRPAARRARRRSRPPAAARRGA